ncbi:arrestin domain-containing protein 3-like isoform X1 [Ostrea edulis]|uniref:arrestin domain-containing protein 3-like isoform X1 n=1 Tax=Ostrea edulis TaxID=37623 RepID=UPI0020954660|nr:arrestin domain-containing protein 3-like isoform X1 [Ostrea edulis]
MGKLDKFDIVFKNSDGVCVSGNPLYGTVVLELSGKLKLHDILLRFHGYASVCWIERHSSGHGKNKKAVAKHFSSEEIYFDHTVNIYGHVGKEVQTLPSGSHSIPFEFHLPADCPTSYEGSIGRVRYYVSARIRKLYEIEHTTMKLFTVINHLDVNNDLRLQQSADANNEIMLCCLCCKSGPISATLFLETIGFVPGEGIPIHVEIENRSGRKISAASVTLLMVVRYNTSKKSKTHTNKVASACKTEWNAGKSGVWTGERLIIPSVPPSYLFGCDIIDISYVLELKVHPSGPSFTLPVKMEVVIGTKPLKNSVSNFSYSGSGVSLNSTIIHSNETHSQLCARYTESVLGKVTVEDDKECDKIPYDITFAPVYPYHSLSNKTDTFQVNSPKTRVKEVQRQQTLPS